MKNDELYEVLKLHDKWFNKQDGGVRADLHRADLHRADLHRADLRDADLRWADLRDANLRGANLRGAVFDFSCWPLFCDSLDVKLDNSQKRQLLYHVLAVCPEYRTKELVNEANKFHMECS